MNKDRRKELSKAIGLLNGAKESIEGAKTIIETCKDEEQECYDGLPESMQEGEKGDAMQENIDDLDEAYYNIEDWPDTVDETVKKIQEAIDR